MAYNNNLCTCCLDRKSVKNLSRNYTQVDKTENYGEMLKDCFGLILLTLENIDNNGICEECIARLQSALDFKRQVSACQERLSESIATKCKLIKLEPSGDEVENGCNQVVDVKNEPPETYDPEDNMADDEDKSLKDLKSTIRFRTRKEKPVSVARIRLKKTKTISMKVPSRNIILKKVRSETRYQTNFHNLVKYSNCTPFTNRTIQGFTCAFCDDVCKTIQNLRDHIRSSHANEVPKNKHKQQKRFKIDVTDLKCKLCNTGANSVKELKVHLIEHNIELYDETELVPEFKFENDKEFKCVVCERNFETYFTLLKHMNEHYKNYVCAVCDTGFMNKEGLRGHKRLHNIGEHPCRHCEKIFETPIKRDNHEKSHKAPINRNCSHCDERFDNYFQRNKHMKLVHNDLPANYSCRMCDKQFITGSKLTVHIKRDHLLEKNHVCSLCEIGFFQKRDLEKHMVKHTGERNFKCKFCGKAYGRKKTLVQHERIHTNDRRYKCPICEAAFVQKCSMKGHMLSNHSISLAEYELANKNPQEDKDVDNQPVKEEIVLRKKLKRTS